MTNGAQVLSLEDFLKEQQKQAPTPQQHAVIGNEAGDADSIVSAIAWSYTERLAGRNRTPVISIPAADLGTQRPETVLLLELAGLTTRHQKDLLHFVDGTFWTAPERLNVTLVDHNRLADKFMEKKHNVVEIIDHHLDEGFHSESCTHRSIAFENDRASVASTCTLVAERLQEIWEPPYPESLSLLLLGVILLDSVNLIPAAGKATPRDAAAIQALLEGTNWNKLDIRTKQVLKLAETDGKPDTSTLFSALQNAKFDPDFWKSLSVRDALRLDYKSFSSDTGGTFGVSTVLLSMDDFLRKDNVVPNIGSYMQEREINFFGIMLSTSDRKTGQMRRQLILCATKGFPLGDMAKHLQKPDSPLQLTELAEKAVETDGLTLRFFDQRNPKASRKQVAPVLFQFFDKA